MSKVGKKPIHIPAWVEVTLHNGIVTVKWPKGTLTKPMYPGVTMTQEWENLQLSAEGYEMRKFWWLMRALIQNMVTGVAQWYSKKMLVLWVWYTAKAHGSNGIEFTLGLSHKVYHTLPDGIKVNFEKDNKNNDIMTFESIDKELLGEACARVRLIKAPEPYKWAGIRFTDEFIKLKPGKAAAK